MEEKALAKKIRTAIKSGNVQEAKRLIDENPDCINMMTPFGTWLHVAAAHGQLEILKFLIERGADVNKCGGIAGGGALHIAASEGHLEIVKYLLSCGAFLDVSEPEKNPLFGAIHQGHTKIAKLLIESGIDTKAQYTGKSMKGMDAMAFAVEWGRQEIAAFLASVDSRDSS